MQEVRLFGQEEATSHGDLSAFINGIMTTALQIHGHSA